MSEGGYLLISKINTVVFCPRRYFIEVVLGEQHANHHIIEGINLHERSERRGVRWVWSDRLQLVGIVDQVTVEDGYTVITEFKKGRMGDHASDQVQLCAQAICFEENTGETLAYGNIHYHSTRRNMRVDFTPELRRAVEVAVSKMREVSASRLYPAVIDNTNKCKGCSVQEACQPKLARVSYKQLEQLLKGG